MRAAETQGKVFQTRSGFLEGVVTVNLRGIDLDIAASESDRYLTAKMPPTSWAFLRRIIANEREQTAITAIQSHKHWSYQIWGWVRASLGETSRIERIEDRPPILSRFNYFLYETANRTATKCRTLLGIWIVDSKNFWSIRPVPTSKRNKRRIYEWVNWFVIRTLPVARRASLRRLGENRTSRPSGLCVNLDAVLDSAVVEDAGFEREQRLHGLIVNQLSPDCQPYL